MESDTDVSAEEQRSQFKPYTQPDTYIAVVNGEIALKVGVNLMQGNF